MLLDTEELMETKVNNYDSKVQALTVCIRLSLERKSYWMIQVCDTSISRMYLREGLQESDSNHCKV